MVVAIQPSGSSVSFVAILLGVVGGIFGVVAVVSWVLFVKWKWVTRKRVLKADSPGIPEIETENSGESVSKPIDITTLPFVSSTFRPPEYQQEEGLVGASASADALTLPGPVCYNDLK